MLRGIKSTQRKIRQIELKIGDSSGALDSDVSVSGPASNQVASCKVSTAQAAGVSAVVSIVLKQAFANDPVVIGNNLLSTGGGKGGAGADAISITSRDTEAGNGTDLLIIGSDVNSKI
jgi:hypothetical protein